MDKRRNEEKGACMLRYRCHFSVIFERLWQFWIVILLMAVNQIDNVVELAESVGEKGISGFMTDGGFIGIAALALITLAVLAVQFFLWRKTFITLEDNLIIIERNTLRKYRNTIAVENLSAINMERNLFERIVGTYKLKLDTNSMTTADETDVTIVFREDIAVRFRSAVIERMNAVKGCENAGGALKERQPDQLFASAAENKDILHCDTPDIIKHTLYTLPLLSLTVAVCGICGASFYVSRFGFDSFIHELLGGFIAVALMVLGSLYNVVKRFFSYYDFTVYRDGKELHVRCGLIKLRSYTIPVDKITAINIEQPLVSRIFRKYSAKVVTVGIGDESGESSNITMSLSAEEMSFWLKTLVPEYVWGDMTAVNREERAGVSVRAFKSVKWHVFSVSAAALLIYFTELPIFVSVGVPAAIDLFILLIYVLSHSAAGYMIREEGMTLCEGCFTKCYSIFKCDRMQVINLTYHPAAKKSGCCNGRILLLNSSAGIPYIKEELALEISDRMIGGKK